MSLSFQRPRVLVLFALALSAALAPGVARGQSKSAKSNKAAKEQPPAAATPAAEKLDYGALLKDLQWRELGPAIMGGRIDDFAVVESNPSTVYVGTASGGVWKTTNAGTTWEPVFDNEGVSTIGDVTVAPSDPAIVWVGTGEPNNRQSSSWGNGVYESTDAGKTWANMGLRDSHHIGRIAIHPANPSVVYVAALGHLWGPNKERGVYKTTDGGKTWTQSLFRSEDKGESWKKVSDTDPRPSYYSQIVIDPNNDLRIWVMGAPMYYSEDGGKTFVTNRVTHIHGDYHALWINPANSGHMIAGSDGGIHWSYDGGRTWEYVNSVALGQFYELGADMRRPYYICGGLQDNGSWCGPSATWFQQGITNEDWYRVDGGDGFYAQVDPAEPTTVYAESQDGNVVRRDLRTNESRNIRPMEKEGEPRYRFQWNSPIVVSAHDPRTIYYGGKFLVQAPQPGDTWTKLGGDLTTGVERDKLPIMGKVPDKDTLSRHDGVQQYPCITTVSESPLTSPVLWVGTDDGNLQVTRDAGKTWKNVAEHVPGVPKGTYVSRVAASRYAEATAYVALTVTAATTSTGNSS